MTGFAPAGRTAVEVVPLAEALGRVPVDAVTSAAALPGFARSTVDGFAVRAADTYGASESVAALLDVVGAVHMGRAPDVRLGPGSAAQMPTGGVLPDGADAVVMVEQTTSGLAGSVEVLRPVAPGDGVVRPDEDVAVGAVLVPAGRPLRPQDLGLLAAAGELSVAVHARPRVAVLSTGDEVVDPSVRVLEPGQVRDATSSALAGMIARAGGVALLLGVVPDDGAALRTALSDALTRADLVVVSAGSSVGVRDETAGAVQALGELWCHGLAVKPGKPTMLAVCDGVPVIGLPGNPLSALVVFGLVGMPLVRRAGGWTAPPADPVVRAVLGRPLASAAGRLDVVQVTVADGVAHPLLGPSATLSLLTRADGFVVVPEDAGGLDEGAPVDVHLHV